jgi:hypothetical protein
MKTRQKSDLHEGMPLILANLFSIVGDHTEYKLDRKVLGIASMPHSSDRHMGGVQCQARQL